MPRKTRIGIIGAGWWATENHIPVLQKLGTVEIAGVCGLGQDLLAKIREKFGIPFATEDYREILALEKLDAVVVSSPHNLHYEHASAALKRGLHVLCEKPMVLLASQARELVELTKQNKVHFVIPYGWNYTELAAEARDRIAKGELGEILHAHLHMASALQDFFSGKPAWFTENSLIQPVSTTWSDPLRGGGFGHGQLTHALGLLFWITKLEPVEVFAFMANSPTGSDLSDAITCRFRNGATGMLGGAATMPPRSTYQVDLRIFGRDGMLMLDIERPRLEVRRNDGQNYTMQVTHAPGAYECVEPLRTFVDLIEGKAVENRSPAEVGARIVEVLDAAFRSARSHKAEGV